MIIGHRRGDLSPRGLHLAAWALVLCACGLSAPRKDQPANRPAHQTCVAPPRPAARASVTRAYPLVRFEEPVALTASPDHAWWYIAERRGRIWRIGTRDEHAASAELVLDLSRRVNASTGAIGLLAIALHPRFSSTGAIYVSYTGYGGRVAMSRVSRFVSRDGGRTFDRASEQRLLEIEQIADFHVNADLQFGPDGYLYAGFGDGGPHGDPLGRAQDPTSLKGKILRLDVDAPAPPYGIPHDNPYAFGGGAPEVWALGLRNPWRFAFDRKTGELWAGDVGSDFIEEINRIERGGNYGWSVREGTRCMTPGACAELKSIDPVVALPHPDVSSITFGVAYRGAALPELAGHLIYADFASGVIWEVDPTARRPEPRMLDDSHAVVAFAEDAAGEPMLVDYAGTLWRIGRPRTGPADLPALLGDTGCFDHEGTPAAGLIPYEINVPFWSDGSTKRRWLALPDGATLGVKPDGTVELPIGSVAIKEFSADNVRLETRLLVRHDDGNWAGYTYRWDAGQREARLIPAQAKNVVTTWPRTWYFPHRGECARCHQAAAGHTLGLELAQLDRIVELDGASVNQLAAFDRLGLFADPLPQVAALPTAGATVEQRARAWLHANCSYCHRPGGSGQGNLDLRFTTPLDKMGVCDVRPQFGSYGVADARRIAPGDPSRSMLLRRMRSSKFIRMPPFGTLGHDAEGSAIVEQWIKQLSCKPSRRAAK